MAHAPDPTQLCACFNLRKAARAVTQAFDAALKTAGLRATQFTLLRMLEIDGEMPMRRLADALVTDPTTLSRNLRPLEARGLLRMRAGADRRSRLVSLTPAGRRAVRAALPLWREAQARFVDRLAPVDWPAMQQTLAAAVAATASPATGAAPAD